MDRDDYLSENAKRIIKAKYHSVIAEHERTSVRSEKMRTKDPFAVALPNLMAAINDWFNNQLDLANPVNTTLGMKFAPVVDGTKYKFRLVERAVSPLVFRIVFFSEYDHFVVWTTFDLRAKKNILGRESAIFSYAEAVTSEQSQERISPAGSAQRFLERRDFAKKVNVLIDLYEARLMTAKEGSK